MLHVLALSPGDRAQFFVEVGLDEPRVGVVLHQTVDLPLSCEEAGRGGVVEALDDGVFRVEIQVDLAKRETCPE